MDDYTLNRMKFDYIKCHGSGNEFVMVDAVKHNLDGINLADFARFVCDRGNSVGADGVLLLDILCRPFFLLPPIPPSIRVFSNESTLHMWWPKYWSFSFSIIPSKEIPGLISFRMDWLDLLAVEGTLN